MKTSQENLFVNYENCTMCPRNCGAERSGDSGVYGVCGTAGLPKVARAALHFWEEPCISGTKGSGAVFFSGCNLHCVFCQNRQISDGRRGIVVTKEHLAEIFLRLQEQGAHNINLVTAGHYVPHVVWAVEHARMGGLHIPVVYNTGSYEKAETLRRLEGIVDIYLPDFKFMEPSIGKKYAHAEDYARWAKEAIHEMVRQQPKTVFKAPKGGGTWSEEYRDGDLMMRGVMVRQLLLPELLYDAKQILNYLFSQYGNRICYSLMSQYTPLYRGEEFPELQRRVREEAYDSLVRYAGRLGIRNGFTQEREVACESFIPEFDGEGV